MDTPNTPVDNGQGGNGNEDFDYQRAYNELRPEYTRVTQDFSQTREALDEYANLFAALQNPETREQALEVLGFEIDSGGPQGGNGTNPNEYVDPLEEKVQQLEATVDELRSQRASEQSEREQENLLELRDEYIGEVITDLEKNLNTKFSQKDEVALGNLAIAMTDEQGLPDVQGAYDMLFGNDGVVESRRSSWIDSKLNAHIPPLGTTLPADQRPKNRAERTAYIDERLAQLDRQQ